MSLHLLPGFKQSPSNCGPVCLQMILEYYGASVSEAELAIAAKTTLERGTYDHDLLDAAKQYGLDGEWKDNATIDDLRAAVDAHVPSIVTWFSTNEVHYSIVIGADEENILLQDPDNGDRESFTHAEFMAVWFSFVGSNYRDDRTYTYPHDSSVFHVRRMLALKNKDVKKKRIPVPRALRRTGS